MFSLIAECPSFNMNHIGILSFDHHQSTKTCCINGGEKFYVPRPCPGFGTNQCSNICLKFQVTFLYNCKFFLNRSGLPGL